MAAKPADFYIGVADLFAIILPGALASYLALETMKPHAAKALFVSGSAQGWVAFSLSSYLLGHFASLMGAAFLDPLYKWTYVRYKKRSATDHLFKKVTLLKNAALESSTKNKGETTNYKWARMNIQLRKAGAMQEIDRLEADSKFFRSVAVVSVVCASPIMSLAGSVWELPTWLAWALWVGLLVLSFWRFSNLRWKASEAAYLTVIGLENTAAEKPGRATADS
jgi:hypothetical protein